MNLPSAALIIGVVATLSIGITMVAVALFQLVF